MQLQLKDADSQRPDSGLLPVAQSLPPQESIRREWHPHNHLRYRPRYQKVWVCRTIRASTESQKSGLSPRREPCQNPKSLMQYRALSFSCECGRAPLRITQVGLTADHQLLIQWWCAGCKKMVHATKSLAGCWRDCPTTVSTASSAIEDGEFDPGSEDARFLQSLGVKLPEDGDS